MYKLILNDDEYTFKDFETATMMIEIDFGYEGRAWNSVISSNNFDELINFLEDDGFDVEFTKLYGLKK